MIACGDDLPAILQLQKEAYLTEAEINGDFNIPPLTQELASLEKECMTTTLLKGVMDNKIVASVRGYSEKETCFIGRLIVSSEYQNKGIGQRMMDAIESHFKGCRRFELFTGLKSEKNLYLYDKLGYREFKRQKMNENLTLIYLEKVKEN